MEEEFLSRLPEELVHLILGFLNTQDAVTVSLLSKSFQAAWLSSSPFLDFHDFYFRGRRGESSDQKLKRFRKYVSATMERVSNHRISITSFEFRQSYGTKALETETLDKYIGIALDGHVREICLSVKIPETITYCLPERVLSSGFLKYLSLRSEFRLLPPGDNGAAINLPCLQSLTLIRVSMNEEVLQGLLKGCPLLEHLTITPTDLLSQLNISHLKLKSLDVSDYASSLVKVEVEAPCLDEFQYSNGHWHKHQTDVILKSSTSKNLKSLSLHLYSSPKKWLSELLSNCTSLETLRLILELSPYLKTINISSPYVKNMYVTLSCLTKLIEIDCPMLLSLCWTAASGCTLLLPSISVINDQPNFAGHLHNMPYWGWDPVYLNTAWFHKLREFLSTSRIAAMSMWFYSHIRLEEEDHQNRDNLPTSAVKIELLCLRSSDGLPESCYTFIMNGFLSTCHPDTIHLNLPAKEGQKPTPFIEFFRKKLENWKDADGCYCSSKIRCWKHQLKTVEIQEFSKLEDNKCHDYWHFGDISSHTSICFKLQWY